MSLPAVAVPPFAGARFGSDYGASERDAKRMIDASFCAYRSDACRGRFRPPSVGKDQETGFRGHRQDADAMSGGFQYFDIILFAMIAGFLVLRLRSVLGRRTGNERRRDGLIRAPLSDKPNRAAGIGQAVAGVAPEAKPVDGVAFGLERIRRADPEFDPQHFLAGARAAFEIIVGAFARGDKSALRPLLSDEVYRPFVATIDERVAAGETVEDRILQLDSPDITAAELSGQIARIVVRYVSKQINVTRAGDGRVVDGDAEHPVEKTDYWTFARDVRSTDPNWVLAATGSA